MNEIGLALLLLASLWAGTTAAVTGLKFNSEIMDKIIVGKAGGEALPVEYRWRLLYVIWFPSRIVFSIVSAAGALIIVMLPDLVGAAKSARDLRLLCYAVSAVPFSSLIGTICITYFEHRYARGVIQYKERQEDAKTAKEP